MAEDDTNPSKSFPLSHEVVLTLGRKLAKYKDFKIIIEMADEDHSELVAEAI